MAHIYFNRKTRMTFVAPYATVVVKIRGKMCACARGINRHDLQDLLQVRALSHVYEGSMGVTDNERHYQVLLQN